MNEAHFDSMPYNTVAACLHCTTYIQKNAHTINHKADELT